MPSTAPSSSKFDIDELVKNYTGDRIKGGKGDRKHPSAFPRHSLIQGVTVELEHTKDANKALEVATDHLSENPAYYRRLKKAGLADELKESASVLSAMLSEVFQPHPVEKETTAYHRATYKWKAGGHDYQAVFHPRDQQAGVHQVDVHFGTVKHDHGGDLDYNAHSLGVDPTDTLATVHHVTKDYLKTVVAHHHPDTHHVIVHCRPTPSRKDTWTIKDGPDTQRGHNYAKLMRRAIKHDPEMSGVHGSTHGEGSKMLLHLSFPQELPGHFAKAAGHPTSSWMDRAKAHLKKLVS
jgi:hypothetical protein